MVNEGPSEAPDNVGRFPVFAAKKPDPEFFYTMPPDSEKQKNALRPKPGGE
jgi:hypothetical protein